MSQEVESVLTSRSLSLCLLHDLLSPLSCILLASDLLARSPTVAREHIPLIKELRLSNNRLHNFIRLVRLHLQGKVSARHVNLCKEIQSALELVRGFALKEGISMEFLHPASIHSYVPPLYIQQICINLVCNAIDAYKKSTNQKKRIIFTINQDASTITICCEDFAGGISPRVRARLFKCKTSTKSGGCGFGLWNVYTIVKEKLGGSIEVKTQSGIGTLFIIQIPISKKQIAGYNKDQCQK